MRHGSTCIRRNALGNPMSANVAESPLTGCRFYFDLADSLRTTSGRRRHRDNDMYIVFVKKSAASKALINS